MKNPMLLDGKKIMVTGASSGIGRATAIYCAELGAQVVLLGRSKKRLEVTLSNMPGEKHITLSCDFSETIDGDALFDKIVADGIKLNGLVHCAGIPCVMPLRSLSYKRLNHVMNVNFYSFIELVRTFVKKKYSNDKASIVGISAALVSHPRIYEMGYIASKAALEAVVPVMAIECQKRNIRVNCIEFGNVYTEMMDHIIKENDNKEIVEQFASKSILGWQKPEDAAKICTFLLDDASACITASIIQADGGYRL